ncbi:hypothetical protein [Verminephrobacter eiseniae]|uniref:hypothetical protein n=1 Tax=Verminephrobacter eiseniae TaxID=364317 RepID=UPI002237E8E4|nr:hypothetical protein [Verminephrobacter eiseniae]
MSDSNLNIGIVGDGFMPPVFFGKALRACLAERSFALRSMQLDGPLRLVSTKKEPCLPIAECVGRPEDDFDIVAGRDILITHLAPVTGQTMARAPRLRLIAARHLVSRHRSDVVGCAQPSERSARRIARPIPSVLASDARPRYASMASADRQMIGDATLGHGNLCDLARTWRARQGRLDAPESEDAPRAPLWPGISAPQAEAERLDNLRGNSRCMAHTYPFFAQPRPAMLPACAWHLPAPRRCPSARAGCQRPGCCGAPPSRPLA